MAREARTTLAHDVGSPEANTGILSTRLRHARPEAWDPARSSASGAAAEQGVRLAYGAAGLPPPKIVWCPSPVRVAAAWARAASDERVGANVKSALFERPYREGTRRIESLALRAAPQASHLLAHGRSRVTGASIAAAVLDAVGGTRPPLLSWIRGRWRGHLLRAIQRPAFAASGCGADELSGISLVAYVEEAFAGATSDARNALRLIAENTGWLVPHEGVCWLSERPDVVCTDARGRLHCISGPALRYREGWSLHAWKGVVVPAWVVLRPHDITLDWIDAQIDAPVRHAMIDIFTAERFIAEGGADPIARVSSATLWRRTWTYRGTVIDAWSAVEYSGTSSKRIFEPVPAHMRSPGEALNWLLGPSGGSAEPER